MKTPFSDKDLGKRPILLMRCGERAVKMGVKALPSRQLFDNGVLKCLFFILCVICTFSIRAEEYNPNLKVAICYFGLTRSVKHTFSSHKINIFHILLNHGIEFDIFMHTWKLNGKQRVWMKEVNVPIDYDEYKWLAPTYYRIDDQDEFTSSLDFSRYFYKDVWEKYGDPAEWHPMLILNHLCALESQKRVTDMVINSRNYYDLIIYVRPDAKFHNELCVKWLVDLKDNEIMVPNFGHYEGYNDQFAILTYQTAPIYGKRIDQIIHFRETQGRIVSEKYVKYICDINQLNVRYIDLNFELVRPKRN